MGQKENWINLFDISFPHLEERLSQDKHSIDWIHKELKMKRRVPSVLNQLGEQLGIYRPIKEEIAGVLSKVKINSLQEDFLAYYKSELTRSNYNDFQENIGIIKTMCKSYQEGKNPGSNIYNQNNLNDRFLDPEIHIARINQANKQTKYSGGSILLGGKLYKKASLRILNKAALLGWLHIISTGVPCQQIIKDKTGKYRIYLDKDENYRVYSIVEDKPNMWNFIESVGTIIPQGREGVKYRCIIREYIDLQRRFIEGYLNSLGIHTDLNKGNLLVGITQDFLPELQVVDLDNASLNRYDEDMYDG